MAGDAVCWRASGGRRARGRRAQLSRFQGRCESQSCPDTTCQVSRPRNSSNVYVAGADPFSWLTSGTRVTRLPLMKTAPTSCGSLGRQVRKNCTDCSAGLLWSCTGRKSAYRPSWMASVYVPALPQSVQSPDAATSAWVNVVPYLPSRALVGEALAPTPWQVAQVSIRGSVVT